MHCNESIFTRTNEEERKMVHLHEHEANLTSSPALTTASSIDSVPSNVTAEEAVLLAAEESALRRSNLVNMGVYAAATLSLIALSMARTVQYYLVCIRASIRLHGDMFAHLLRAPSSFFDSHPSGRVLNRFSKDMGAVDEMLPPVMLDVLGIFLSVVGIVAVVVCFKPVAVVPSAIMFVASFYLRR